MSWFYICCISSRVLQPYGIMQAKCLLLEMHMVLSCRLMHMPLAVLSPSKLNGWLSFFLMSMSTPLQQGSSGACCILIQLADPLCSRHLKMTFCSLNWSMRLLLLPVCIPVLALGSLSGNETTQTCWTVHMVRNNHNTILHAKSSWHANVHCSSQTSGLACVPSILHYQRCLSLSIDPNISDRSNGVHDSWL